MSEQKNNYEYTSPWLQEERLKKITQSDEHTKKNEQVENDEGDPICSEDCEMCRWSDEKDQWIIQIIQGVNQEYSLLVNELPAWCPNCGAHLYENGRSGPPAKEREDLLYELETTPVTIAVQSKAEAQHKLIALCGQRSRFAKWAKNKLEELPAYPENIFCHGWRSCLETVIDRLAIDLGEE